MSGTDAALVFALTGNWDDGEFRDTGGGSADAPAAVSGGLPSDASATTMPTT